MGKLVISLTDATLEENSQENTEKHPTGAAKAKTQPYFGVWLLDSSNAPVALFPVEHEAIALRFTASLKEDGIKFVTSIVELPEVKLVTRAFVKGMRESLDEH